jgi:uncharacterized protein
MTSTPADGQSTRAKLARSQLRRFAANADGFRSCALVSFDGLVIASVLASGVDGDRFGAMCASLLALASRAAQAVMRGELRQIILDGTNGPVLITQVGTTGVLAVATDSSEKLGKLIVDTRLMATTLVQLFGPDPLASVT